MRKEWLAVVLLLSVALCAIMNLRLLKSFTRELDVRVNAAATRAYAGDWAAAEALASDAMRDWSGMDKYTHIFIRHEEIDEVTDGFCSLLGTIRCQDTGALFVTQLVLCNRLAELYEMERLTPGSIL